MLDNTEISIQVDAELKRKAEQILSQFGITTTGAVNMFLQQIVRERTIPSFLLLDLDQALYADLLTAQTERNVGYIGRTSDGVLADMHRLIERASSNSEI